jgi:deoxycytidylate deaminase
LSIRKLIKTARKSTHRSYHHGAIVIRGGAIISSGYNHGFIHAEVHAIKKLWPNTVKGCSVMVVRVTDKGFGKSKPCAECYKYMRDVGIGKVTYTDIIGDREIWVTAKVI